MHTLHQVDPTATASFLGYVVAAYSLGQLVASPFFGVWSNYRPVREPLVVSTIINVAANIVYAYGNAFPSGKKWVLLVSRAFVGFGAGESLHWVLLELVTMQYFGMLGGMVCIPVENVGCSHTYTHTCVVSCTAAISAHTGQVHSSICTVHALYTTCHGLRIHCPWVEGI